MYLYITEHVQNTTQRATESAMLGVKQQDRVGNSELQRCTKLSIIGMTKARPKLNWAEYR